MVLQAVSQEQTECVTKSDLPKAIDIIYITAKLPKELKSEEYYVERNN
jgi:hypothetical protein